MKRARKQALANMIYKSQGVSLDTNSIFDVQVKRLHEYKTSINECPTCYGCIQSFKNRCRI